ncbi:MAG: hypothetical protein ACYTEL_26920, partial [Planctomycetota bacterium]
CVFMSGYGNFARGADWPNWRGPNRNGISDETGWTTDWPAGGPKLLWKEAIGTGFSSMAVSDGKVYAMGNVNKANDIVYCFDAETGKEIWRHMYSQQLDPKHYEGGPPFVSMPKRAMRCGRRTCWKILVLSVLLGACRVRLS